MIKTVWIDAYSLSQKEHLIDGPRLADDTEKTLNKLESNGYEIVSITPILSGRYSWKKYDSRIVPGVFKDDPTISPDTCASWGYSVTDGLLVVAKKNL